MLPDLHPPRTLECLRHYARFQEELIKPLLQDRTELGSHFRETDIQEWTQFHSSVWGKGPNSLDTTEPVIRGPDPISGSLIHPDVVPSDRSVMPKPDHLDSCWRFTCEKFFIRPEYKEAEEFVISIFGAVQAVTVAGLVISGQRGIGKSVLLLRILLRRLTLKLPTVLQIRSNYALLFHEGGVEEFSHLDGKLTYAELESFSAPLSRIWALVDANDELPTPAPMFKDGPFFIVQAALPRPAHRDWTTGKKIIFFYMKPWSFPEVLQVRSLIKPALSEERLWGMHLTYGAPLGSLFTFANIPETYHGAVLSEMRQLSTDGLANLLRFTTATDDCHHLISTRPSPTDRTKPERKINSQYIFGECCRRILRDDVEQLRMFYNMLREKQDTFVFAGMIFEHRAHQFLREGRDVNLFPLLANNSPEGGNYIFNDYKERPITKQAMWKFTLPRMEEHLVDEETESTNELYTYYRPRSNNFPSIDSWILIRHNPRGQLFLLAFHMMINGKQQGLNKVGLDRLGELAPEDAIVCPVILTPKGVEPYITMQAAYLTKEFLDGRGINEAFPVSHFQIDAVELFEPL